MMLSPDSTTTARPPARSRSRCGRCLHGVERLVQRGHDPALRRSRTARRRVARARASGERQFVEDAAGLRLHHHDAVGQGHRLVDVVRDDAPPSGASRSHRPSRCSCRLARVKASSAENGSSSSSTFGFGHERAGDRDALLLAAGELARPAAPHARRARPSRARARRGRCRSARRQRRRGRSPTLSATVSQGSSRGSWNTMPTAGCGPAMRLAVEADRAGAGAVEPGDEAQQRRLAAARAADQRDDLADSRPTGRYRESARCRRRRSWRGARASSIRRLAARAVSCQRTSGPSAATSSAVGRACRAARRR